MRALLFALATSGCLIGAVTTASAQQAIDEKSVVDFFVKSADLGASRGICIGTQEECAVTTKAPALDMLISFELASDKLTPSAQQNLEIFSRALKDERLAVAKFVVEGHTDASGSEAYNDSLADRRANTVVSYLVDRGIERERLVPVGMGERSPRTSDAFDPENRRVEMRITLK